MDTNLLYFPLTLFAYACSTRVLHELKWKERKKSDSLFSGQKIELSQVDGNLLCYAMREIIEIEKSFPSYDHHHHDAYYIIRPSYCVLSTWASNRHKRTDNNMDEYVHMSLSLVRLYSSSSPLKLPLDRHRPGLPLTGEIYALMSGIDKFGVNAQCNL